VVAGRRDDLPLAPNRLQIELRRVGVGAARGGGASVSKRGSTVVRALQRSLIGPVACGALAFLVAFGVRAEPV